MLLLMLEHFILPTWKYMLENSSQVHFKKIPNSAACVVKRLLEPIDKSGRNITMDNYLTSVPLANKLYANHWLTIVETLRKNKTEIPPDFTNLKTTVFFARMFLKKK